ncbi:unnamed protein product [Lactuca saligna]|uniref:Uncharacterized protein n=1 Tax=Lactuca saligna TaxID=75948 RepID=A0AA36DUP4_LACSI|nr:unnamed protein product [Lactuca saligna]
MNTSIQSPSNQDLMQRPMDFAGEHHHAIRTAGSGTMTEAAQSTRNVDLSPEAPCSDPIRLSTSATSNCEQPSLLGMSRIRQHSDRYFIFRILLSIVPEESQLLFRASVSSLECCYLSGSDDGNIEH